MSLLDAFKHKEKPAAAKGSSVAKEEKKPEKAVVKPATKKSAKSDIPFLTLESPHVTEKASILAEDNKYVFKVSDRSNKIEIKKAVKELYHVKVESVNIIKIHRKKKRVGRKFGWKKGYKKAIVEIKKGQKIEIMPR